MERGDVLLCDCNAIYTSQMVAEIKKKKIKTVKEVGEKTSFRIICSNCIESVDNILKKINR